jgi:HAE1 family hydrophobic/amphiphilic exporter-1
MSKFFIRRPIVAIVISILTVIVGAISVVSLPVSQFPAIAPPEVQVQTTYVGADAQTVEQSVATPIEQQMSGVDNSNYMYSVNSSTGESRLIVDYDVKTDPNTDLILTQIRETQAASQLPPEVNNFGVTVQKTLTAPLMLISLYSPSGVYDSKFLANYAYINLYDPLSRVPGIGSVQVFGAGKYAMRLWVKPDQLAKLSITVPEIINGTLRPVSSNASGMANNAAFPLSVSKMVSTMRRSTPPSSNAFASSKYVWRS